MNWFGTYLSKNMLNEILCSHNKNNNNNNIDINIGHFYNCIKKEIFFSIS